MDSCSYILVFWFRFFRWDIDKSLHTLERAGFVAGVLLFSNSFDNLPDLF